MMPGQPGDRKQNISRAPGKTSRHPLNVPTQLGNRSHTIFGGRETVTCTLLEIQPQPSRGWQRPQCHKATLSASSSPQTPWCTKHSPDFYSRQSLTQGEIAVPFAVRPLRCSAHSPEGPSHRIGLQARKRAKNSLLQNH